MKLSKSILFITLSIWCLCSCRNSVPASGPSSIKEMFADNFRIGSALNRSQILERDDAEVELIKSEFNSITPENIMKWMHIHPEQDSFDFEFPDKLVELGTKHDMFIVGHTLVWHSQLASWVPEIKDSSALESHLSNHIQTIVKRYAGKVHAWDVVNEALNNDGTLRETHFLTTMGENYIQTAFELAAAADPTAELYYNDYSLTHPAKRKGAIKLIKQLQDSGTKIDGIGLQAHWGLTYPSLEEIEQSILAYAELGIEIMFTELDITVLPNPNEIQGAAVETEVERNELLDPYQNGLADSVQQELAKRYEDIFRLFLKYEDKISRVTFWGVHDGQSWKNNWPVRGRTNYPLLFDRELQPKAAYHKILGLKKPVSSN